MTCTRNDSSRTAPRSFGEESGCWQRWGLGRFRYRRALTSGDPRHHRTWRRTPGAHTCLHPAVSQQCQKEAACRRPGKVIQNARRAQYITTHAYNNAIDIEDIESTKPFLCADASGELGCLLFHPLSINFPAATQFGAHLNARECEPGPPPVHKTCQV